MQRTRCGLFEPFRVCTQSLSTSRTIARVQSRTSSSSSSTLDEAAPTLDQPRLKVAHRRNHRLRSLLESEESRIQKREGAVKSLTEDLFFFTRKSPARSEPKRNQVDDLLNLCDQAIILSRTSSAEESYYEARTSLSKASVLFSQIVRREKREKGQVPDMSYEIYLLRSGYLQVVRSILALVGVEAVNICSKIMIDYLRWERVLRKSKVETQDGTEQLPSMQAKLEGKLKIQEEKFFYGPFVQDSAPVLYDLFSHLTTSHLDASSTMKPVYHGDEGEKRLRLVSKLWKSILRIPPEVWKKPTTVPWRSLRSQQDYKSDQDLIARSMILHGEALLRSGMLIDCLDLWRDGLPIGVGSRQEYSSNLLSSIVNCLFSTRLYIRHGNSSEGNVVSAREYFETLHTMMAEFRTILPLELSTGRKKRKYFDAILRHCLSVVRTYDLREQSLNLEEEVYIQRLVDNTIKMVRAWILNWCDDSIKHVETPHIQQRTTCHIILRHLIAGSYQFPRETASAMKFLQQMIGNPNLPNPDTSTSSVLLRSAKVAGDEQVARSIIDLMKSQIPTIKGDIAEAADELDEDQEDDTELGYTQDHSEKLSPSPSTSSTSLLLLVEEAIQRGDSLQLVTLLKRPKRKAGSKFHAHHLLSQYAGSSTQRLVFKLYPQLEAKARRFGRRHTEDEKVMVRTERMKDATLNPDVLAAALDLIVVQGKTGLAERVWRLIKRESEPKEQPRSRPAWPIPIRAYIAMMRIYGFEVYRGSVVRNRQSAHHSSRSSDQRRKVDASYVRGWGHVRTGPLSGRLPKTERLSRATVARYLAKQEYYELRNRWKEGRAEKPNRLFWTTLLKVFRRRGNTTGEIELESDSDMEFYRIVQEDMALATPSRFYYRSPSLSSLS